ncbi:hypothetical protein Ga0080574_TMP4806 [Salipiger abyssi]|uniref:Uncharacterized protein n=1 Tax=Salipiger abyssi TaxID=1250539 RepID=A0A1P8V0G1_9RHOB|nr:hypothetical protein Ga0080574_TMP4806 [Salipiger abyssi]
MQRLQLFFLTRRSVTIALFHCGEVPLDQRRESLGYKQIK